MADIPQHPVVQQIVIPCDLGLGSHFPDGGNDYLPTKLVQHISDEQNSQHDNYTVHQQ